jgi:hypothetical protein
MANAGLSSQNAVETQLQSAFGAIGISPEITNGS